VSGTGSGEHFMRAVLAHTVAARMRYRGESLAVAARKALREVEKLGGTGGLVAVDAKGHIAMPFNTEGMYRGCVTPRGEWIVEIYGD
jgi:beta-aspartyl-peptidase (threonine type)